MRRSSLFCGAGPGVFQMVQHIKSPRSVVQSSTLSCPIEHGQLLNRARSVVQSSTVSYSIGHGQLSNRARSVDKSGTVSCLIGHAQLPNQCHAYFCDIVESVINFWLF